MVNQLKLGINVEREHKGTIKLIKNYLRLKKRFPSNKAIFKSIAKDHLKENRKYYSKLKRAKL